MTSPIIRMAHRFLSLLADPRPKSIALEPTRDIALVDGAYVATSNEPWLRIDYRGPSLAGRWIELIYDASLLEPLARPILRCLTEEGETDRILPGPIFGRAIWRGFIPSRTREIWISPTDQEGPLGFRITRLRTLSLWELVWRSRRPKAAFAKFDDDPAAQRDFQSVLTATPLGRYSKWRDIRRRPVEWSGLDALPAKGRGPHIRVIAPDADRAAIARWLSILRAQPWPNWSFAAPVVDQSQALSVKGLAPRAKLGEALLDLQPSDLFVVIGPGESWSSEALAIIGAAARRTNHDLFYADEELLGSSVQPLFKPDWGPVAGQNLDLMGRAWFARVGWARSALVELEVAKIPSLAIRPGDAQVKHIARVVVSHGSIRRPALAVASSPARPLAKPAATVVIPTRDRIDLLQRCVAGLRNTQSDIEAIIVDNGSIEPQTHEFFAELVQDSRFRVISRPGPFNFAALCNDAAREARAPNLLFLNNDTEARSSDWLERLLSWTHSPTIGAVGAKLIFPDGGLQHGGVVVGVDGHANHFDLRAGPVGEGYFGRLLVPHELSAVTGACLAVEKAKFDAVGGFDAENLPVEFNDIDLCLRLVERGWTSLLEPRAILIHHQAATRKVSEDQERRYAKEVAYFKNRWRRRLRADPFFHPALSLEQHNAALG
jgi:GT2 family glycosyltransferase